MISNPGELGTPTQEEAKMNFRLATATFLKLNDTQSLSRSMVSRSTVSRLSRTVIIFIATVAALDSAKQVLADGLQTAGDVLQLVLPAAAASLTFSHRDGQGALELGESMAATLGITYPLKYTITAERPNEAWHSFPSGHTSISFSAAEFMNKRYGWHYGVPAFAAASLVGYSRVESRQHYPQDVVAGAAIGILSSYVFTKPYKGWHVGVEGGHKRFEVLVTRHF
jgi:membrane-associated phospholipid phosphatase